MDTRDFPDEILLDIVHYIGHRSSHDLRGIALVSRRWYLVAAPRLLSTIRVTSLGDLVRLCDHLAAAHVAQNFLLGHPTSNSHNYVSMIEHHTRSISINGSNWPREIGVIGDYYTGLDEYQPPGGNSLATAPDVQIKYRDMLSKLGASIPHLKQLESIEWYGRFPGDYYLVNYLVQTRTLSRLILCIDDLRVRIPQSYCNIAMAFKRLKEFSVETRSGDYSSPLIPPVVNLLHRSPGLERIVLWSAQPELFSKSIHLSPTNSAVPFVWPNLQHLEIRYLEGSFWDKLENAELFVQFLCAHKQLETLIIGPCHHFYNDKPYLRSFSFSSHLDALPNLKYLHASLPMIAGILESISACSALDTIVDTGTRSITRATHEPVLEAIIRCLESAPSSRLRRLCIGVAQIQYELFRRLAKVAPGIQALELKNPGFRILDDDTTEDPSVQEEPPNHIVIETIVSGLNLFPQLHTVGTGLANHYRWASETTTSSQTPGQYMLSLAKEVPRLRFVHVGNGALLAIQHIADETSRADAFECISGWDDDWRRFWKTQPMSQAREEECRKVEYSERFEGIFRHTS